ncbi:MAG: hypothetical protein PHT84_02420 [Candidatus Pacebacteria bacterium]|jgi:putative mRNA 3-end processing factor|nr:hypothetical protein [Candidatus Paceibacterota bacterium]
MSDGHIGVTASGVVLLGPDVTCDGFHRDYPVRVQTHVHIDHMSNFESSKGIQDIYLTEATRKLLIAEFNADLSVRDNIVALGFGDWRTIRTSRVMLQSSNHMLGSVQVAVELAGGRRVGYSGDFQWPLDKVIEVDELVLDSTYGSENSVRTYTQEEAEQQLLSIAIEKLKQGPIHLKAHRGTVHRGLQVLSELEHCALIASPRMCKEIDVYREYGCPIGHVLCIKSPEAKAAVESGRYIRFYGTGDQFPIQVTHGTTISLSAFRTDHENPVLLYSDRSLSVALTNHADFAGTLEYVQATGAKHVITDNARGGHAVELAIELKRRLGIKAEASECEISMEWGT